MSNNLNRRAEEANRWVDVAVQRGGDAYLLATPPREVAAVYMLGYVIEAYAKALCVVNGVSVPQIHGVIDLLERCGFKRQDLPPDLRDFADNRSVALRYETSLDSSVDFKTEYARGVRLAQWLRIRVNRLL